MSNPRRQLAILAALTWLSTSCLADQKIRFDLHADVFPQAILEFYQQSKVKVLFFANASLFRIRTQPVVGEFEPKEALENMLEGTGLTFEIDTQQTVIIRQPKAQRSP